MGTIATLQLLYIENHPDRMGFYGTTDQLIAWGVRMGLISEEEGKTF